MHVFSLQDDSHGFFSKNSMVLNTLGLSYGAGILTTVSLFPIWRKRFVQEQREGLYSGVTLLLSYNCYSVPFSFISAALGASVIYPMILDPSNLENGYPFIYIFVAIWTSSMLSEQLSIFLLFFIKKPINAVVAVSYIVSLSLVLGSGTVRSFKGLPSILQDNAKGTHSRYASELLHSAIFLSRRIMQCVPKNNVTCPSPKEFLLERLNFQNFTNEITDISIAFAFALGLAFFNMIIYLLPRKNDKNA
jgi:ATP-binding cassette subfamily G (WHITE) protein 5 (sterolin 1)